jgi:membrane protein YqaA with SNARE-associated domain
MIEKYLLLFFDCFFAGLIVPPKAAMILPAMIIFNNFNPYILFILALSGNILASIINFWLGGYFNFIKEKRSKILPKNSSKNHNLPKYSLKKFCQNNFNQKIAKKILTFSLLFSFIPIIGNGFIFLAGFVKINFRLALISMLTGQFFYYLKLIFFSNFN